MEESYGNGFGSEGLTIAARVLQGGGCMKTKLSRGNFDVSRFLRRVMWRTGLRQLLGERFGVFKMSTGLDAGLTVNPAFAVLWQSTFAAHGIAGR